ncbi:MAG: tetratricopeptide repeat protein [Bacteroidales bacterium]|nr:tetratricopeptide repeat protein [Bacteroidales bacterium]
MASIQPLIKKYAIILITIIGIIAYANSFNNAFQFDDGYHIVEGSKIKNFDNVLKFSHWKAINDRPLSFFTLAVNYKLNELDVAGYHVVNLLFHILAGLIAFLLTFEILSLPVFRKNRTIQDYKVLIALFSSMIFVAHPIQTQAVTYITQRMTVMAGLFYMWSVLLYIRGRNAHLEPARAKAWKSYAYYAGAIAAGALGFLSKQNAATFPLAFILVEILFIRDQQEKIDRRFLTTISCVVGGIILLGIILNGLPSEYDKISRSEYLFTQFRVMVKYWQLLFLPINQHLDYYWTISISLWGYKDLLSLALLLGTIALGVFLFRKNWLIPAFAIFWFYLTLSIESTIIPIRDVIFEHRMYMAVFGIGFAFSYLAFYFLGRKKQIYPVIVLSILTLVYMGASFNRNKVWKNIYTLWSDSTTKDPKRERAWYWLASYYTLEKDPENALKCYNTSIECNPNFPLAYNGSGNVKKETGDLKGALKDYNKAIQLDPNYMTAYYNRGIANAAMNQLSDAIKDYDQSIQVGNRSSAVYYNRGNAKRRKGQYSSAIEDYNIALEIDPKYPLAYFNRGLTKAGMKDHEGAIADIDFAIRLDPKNHLFYNGKGVSLLSLGKYQEAVNNFDLSIQMNSDFGQAYYNRGYAKLNGLSDLKGACEDWTVAASKGYKSAEHYIQLYCK